MNWDLALVVAPIVLSAIPNVVLAVQWALRKSFATTDTLVSVHKVLDDQSRENAAETVRAHHRIDLLEKDVRGQPDFKTVNELKAAVSELTAALREVKAEVRSVDDKLDSQSHTVQRIEQHLLDQAKSN